MVYTISQRWPTMIYQSKPRKRQETQNEREILEKKCNYSRMFTKPWITPALIGSSSRDIDGSIDLGKVWTTHMLRFFELNREFLIFCIIFKFVRDGRYEIPLIIPWNEEATKYQLLSEIYQPERRGLRLWCTCGSNTSPLVMVLVTVMGLNCLLSYFLVFLLPFSSPFKF